MTFSGLKSKLILALLVLGFCAYFTSLFGSFLWDDEQFIQKNVYITSFSYLPQIFSTNTIAGAGENSNYYRPLTTLSFALDYQIWGLNSFGFHLTNTLLHLGVGVLLFLLLDELGLGLIPSFIVALLFLIHPIQTEAVSYANSRGDSLSALFLVAGLWLFARGKRWWGVPLFAASVLAKEIALASSPLFLLILLVQKRWRKADLLPIGAMLIFTAIYWSLRLTVLNFGNSLNFYGYQNLYTSSLLVRLLTFSKIFWTYLGLLFWPYPLHMERNSQIITSPLNPWVLAFVGFALLSLGAGFWAWRKRQNPWLLFGELWFVFTIFPTTGVVPINGLLYEHWLYLPMVGVAIILIGLFKLTQPYLPSFKHWQIPLIYLGSALTLLLIGLTIHQNSIWNNPISFYEYTLQYANSARLHNNLAMSYADAGQPEKAIPEYQKAIALSDTYAETHHNLGNSYFALGKYDLAEQEYLKALQLDPNFFFTYPKLVDLYLTIKQPDKALPYLQKMLKLAPNDPQLQQLYQQLTHQK